MRGGLVLAMVGVGIAGCGGGDEPSANRTRSTAQSERFQIAEKQEERCEALTGAARAAQDEAMKELKAKGYTTGEFNSGASCISVPANNPHPSRVSDAEKIVRQLPGSCPGSTITRVRCEPGNPGWKCTFRDSGGGTGSARFGSGTHPEINQIC